jgi:CRISPR/Cas system-associated endonuclease Cas1
MSFIAKNNGCVILSISEGNNLHQKILKQQINTTEPVRKNLWKQVIQQKITNQLKKSIRQYLLLGLVQPLRVLAQ